MNDSEDKAWAPVTEALQCAAIEGRSIDVWLRDDDAVTTSQALEKLVTLARAYRLPVLLAVIPALADPMLAAFVTEEPLLTPTQHGYAHTNHASRGQRACEMGGDRPLSSVLAEIERGRERLGRLFGALCTDILVPPWNRIDPRIVPQLPGLGFGSLSTFGSDHGTETGLDIVNCDLDIIDWRGGRRCHPEGKLVVRLAALIDRGAPIGILTHHLVHDEEAWHFLDKAFARLTSHRSVMITSADTLRSKLRRRKPLS